MSEQTPNVFSQVDQQIAGGQPATVLVERSNGDITTAQVAGITEGSTNAFFGDITEGPKHGMPYKPVGNEKLSDKYQEYLAEKLAGVALRAQVALDLAPTDTQTEAVNSSPVELLHDVAKMREIRAQVDDKYNQVRQNGGTHEQAEAAANKIWKNYGIKA